MTEKTRILAKPKRPYKKGGSKGMSDSHGSRKTAPRSRKYLPYKEARNFVCSLKLKSRVEWRKFRRGELTGKGIRSTNIPSNPDITYAKKGWESWGDWLGTNSVSTKHRFFRPFKEARNFTRSLNLKSRIEWRHYCNGKLTAKGRRPKDIPSKPEITYAEDGWNGFGDWLGTGRISNKSRVHRSFEEAREFVRSLHLKSAREWFRFSKGQMQRKVALPSDIPSDPRRIYLNKGWEGYGDWIGTGTIAPSKRKFRSFEDARRFVHLLNLKNQNEWRKFCTGKMPEMGTLPSDIPTNPHHTYAKYWVNTADWLGSKNPHQS